MSKIVLFSDLHAHPFKPYSTILPSGLNSRLADAIDCVRQVHDIAVEVDADLVLFGGDCFHVRRHIAVSAFNAVYEAMAQFTISKIPVLMIHGNHDQADRAGEEHSIHAFRSFLHIADTPGWVTVEGKSGLLHNVMAVPYMENVPTLRDVVRSSAPCDAASHLLLGHLGVQGARVGADFVYTNPHDPAASDLATGRFDFSFLGHYHEHQEVRKNCWYIGAPLQHTWGDSGDDRGCLVYDTDTRTFERRLLKAPRFVKLDLLDKNAQKINYQDCYVRVTAKTVWEEDEKRHFLDMTKARSVEVVPPKTLTPSPSSTRLSVSPETGYQDMITEYVTSGFGDMEGLDPDYLINIGREILQETNDEVR